MGQLVFQATAGGQVALVGPNPSTSFSLNVPAVNSTLATLAAQTFTGQQTDTVDASISGLTVGKGAGSQSDNTALGTSALIVNTTGNRNTALGLQALSSNTTGSDNTAVGRNALVLSTGSSNTSVGADALHSNTTASNNTAVGYQAGYSNTTGDVTVFGYQAGYSSTTATGITFVGSLVGKNNTASNNTVVGGNVNGVLNPAFYANTTGNDNAGLGNGVLSSNTSGAFNTAIGSRALASNTTSSNNTAVGYQAGYSNTTGSQLVCVGQGAGYNSTAGSNLFIGNSAGYSVTTGTGNTFLGTGISGTTFPSGYYVTTGSKNSILGNYNGNQGGLDIRTASNYIVLSDGDGNPRAYWSNIGTMYMNQDLGGVGDAMDIKDTGSSYGSGAVYIKFLNNAGSLAGSIQHTASTTTNYNTSSDERLKTDKGIAIDTSVIDNTIIHDYEWKEDGRLDRGVFAQEAYQVKPSAVAVGDDKTNEEGVLLNPWGVDYSKYVPDLIVYCQQLKARIETLEAQLGAK